MNKKHRKIYVFLYIFILPVDRAKIIVQNYFPGNIFLFILPVDRVFLL